MVRAYVGLGANLGDAVAAIEQALAALAALPGTTLVARSSLYRSAPVEAQGPDFVNAVAAIETALDAPALLAQLHAIEAGRGRERPYRNAPRTLDLDLLLWGELQCDTPSLTLPHPRLHLRAFVLEPLAELDPTLVIPGRGPLAGWRQRAASQRVVRLPSTAPAGGSSSHSNSF
jgi:2-amino-4-hydroxy-6-hydroxymethyldihydropteridine diphosphokinase